MLVKAVIVLVKDVIVLIKAMSILVKTVNELGEFMSLLVKTLRVFLEFKGRLVQTVKVLVEAVRIPVLAVGVHENACTGYLCACRGQKSATPVCENTSGGRVSASPGFESDFILKVVRMHVGVMRVFTVYTHL
jgi:hypothetical protein